VSVFFGTSSVIHKKGLNQGKFNRRDIKKLSQGRIQWQSLMNTFTDLLVPQQTGKLFASWTTMNSHKYPCTMKSVPLGKIITQILQQQQNITLTWTEDFILHSPMCQKTTVASYHIISKVSLATIPLYPSQCHTTTRIEKLPSPPPTSHNNHLP
jgi:hypothetical protein